MVGTANQVIPSLAMAAQYRKFANNRPWKSSWYLSGG